MLQLTQKTFNIHFVNNISGKLEVNHKLYKIVVFINI